MSELKDGKRIAMSIKAFHSLGEKFDRVNYDGLTNIVRMRTGYKNLYILKEGKIVPMFDENTEYNTETFQDVIRENDTVYFYEAGKVFPKVLKKESGVFVVPEKETKDENLLIPFDRLEKNEKDASYNAFNEMEDKSPERIHLFLQKCESNRWPASKEEIEYAMNPNNKILSPFQIERMKEIAAGRDVSLDDMTDTEKLVMNSMFYSKYKDICAYNSVELLTKKIKEDFPQLKMDNDKIKEMLAYKVSDDEKKSLVDGLNSKEKKLPKKDINIEKHVEKIKYNFERMEQIKREVNAIIFDNAYIKDKLGEKHFYKDVKEFDALMSKYGSKEVLTEASRRGNESAHVMLFLNSKGITYENYKELLEYPETDKAKEIKNRISSLKQEYADFVSSADPEIISDVYSKVLCQNADEMTKMFSSVDNWENLEKSLDKMSYYHGGQSTFLQTFNLGRGGSKTSDLIFAKIKEKCEKENINSSAYGEVLMASDAITQRFNSYYRRHAESFYKILEDKDLAADYWGAIVSVQFAKRMLVNNDRSVVNLIPSLSSDVTVVNSLEYDGQDVSQYLEAMENGISDENVQLFFGGNISQPYAYYNFGENSVEKWNDYCLDIQNINEEDKIKNMSASEFGDCVNEKMEQFTIFSLSETARFFREHPTDNNKSFDEMSLVEQNMYASKFLAKYMYVLSINPSLTETVYNSFDAEERKLFARALNLTAGSKEFGDNKTLNTVRKGIFNELAQNDLKECIKKEIAVNGGSDLFKKVADAMDAYVASGDYLNSRYGAITHNGKVRLSIVDKYADVLCKDPEKRFITEFDHISQGDKSEEYQAFMNKWKEYYESKDDVAKMDNLRKLSEAASYYMEMKGDSKRGTERGQRRYDLAKKINEYSLAKRNEMRKEEILKYGEALKEGKDVSKFSQDAKDYYALYKHIQVVNAKDYKEWTQERNINNITIYDDMRLNQAVELWDAYKKDKSSEQRIKKICTTAKEILLKYGTEASLENTDYHKFKNRQDEETYKRNVGFVTDTLLSFRDRNKDLSPYSKVDTNLNFFQIYQKNKKKGIENFMKSLRIAVKDESVPGKHLERFVLVDAQNKTYPLFSENESLTDEEAYYKFIGHVSDVIPGAKDICYYNPENAHYLKVEFRGQSMGLWANPSNHFRDFESIKNDFDNLLKKEARQDSQKIIDKLEASTKESRSIVRSNSLLKPACNPDSKILHSDEFTDYVNESDLSEEICMAICNGAALSPDNLRKQKGTSSSTLIMDEGEEEVLVQSAGIMIYDNVFTMTEIDERMGGFVSAIIEGRKLTEEALRDVKNGNYEKATEYLLNLKKCISSIGNDCTINISSGQNDLVERMLDRYEEAAKDPRFSEKLAMTSKETEQFGLFRQKRAVYKEKNDLAAKISKQLMNSQEVSDEDLKRFIGMTSILHDMEEEILKQRQVIYDKSRVLANEEKERKEKQNIKVTPVDLANLQTMHHGLLIKNREFTMFEKEILANPDKVKDDYVKFAEGKYEYKLFKSLRPEELLSVISKELFTGKMGYENHTEVGINFGDLTYADKIRAIKSYVNSSDKNVLESSIIYSFRESMLPSFSEELQEIYLSAAKGEKNQNIDKLPDYAQFVLASELYRKHKDVLKGCDTVDFAMDYFEKSGISVNPEITKMAFELSEANTTELASKIAEKGYTKVSPYIRKAIESETRPKERIILLAKIYQLSHEFTNQFTKEDSKYLHDQVMDFLRPVKNDYLGNEYIDEETFLNNIKLIAEIYSDVAVRMGEENLRKKAELDKIYPNNFDSKNRDINLELAKQYSSFGENQATKEAMGFLFYMVEGLKEKDSPREAMYKEKEDEEFALIDIALKEFRDNCSEEKRKLYDLGIDTSVNLKKTAPGYNAEEFDKLARERRFRDAQRLADVIPQAREAEKQELEEMNSEKSQKQNTRNKPGIKHFGSTVLENNSRKLRMDRLKNTDSITEVEDEEGWEISEDEDFNDLDKSFTIEEADNFERDFRMKNVIDSLNAEDSSKSDAEDEKEQINFKDFLAEEEESEKISKKRIKTNTKEMGMQNTK